MAAPYVFTFADALDHLDQFASYAGLGASQHIRRECIMAAYREIVGARDWTFLRSNARIMLRTPQTTGTAVFDLTGGAYERMLTLTGATWPSWAVDACVRLGDPEIVCDIAEVKTTTIVTLDPTMCPIADVASTTYSLYPRWYRLPNDFASMGQPMAEDDWIVAELVSKERIEHLNRWEDRTGDIEYYAFGAPLDLYGAMAFYTHPQIDEDQTLDIPYVRRPRDMVYAGHDSRDSAGTIAVTASSATVTGTTTTFASAMIGSILRIGSSTTYCPDGLAAQYPYAEQRSILSVASTLSLTLDANVATTRTGVKYRITDPIDLDIIVYNAFLRGCEARLAQLMRLKDADRIEADYEKALLRAKEADCRDIQPVVAGVGRGYVSRLTDSSNRDIVSF